MMSSRTFYSLVLAGTLFLFSCASKKQLAVSTSSVEHHEHSKKNISSNKHTYKHPEKAVVNPVENNSGGFEKASDEKPLAMQKENLRQERIAKKVSKKIDRYTKRIKIITEKHSASEDGNSGLALVFIGLLFLLLAFVFLATLGAFGVIFFIIFGIASAVCIIFGILKLIFS